MNDEKPRILVVDDHKGLEECYADFLRDENFIVLTATEVAKAVSVLQQDPPDMIVADVAKFQDRSVLADAVLATGVMLVWASRFENLDIEDLPVMARILNKPFRCADLKFTIRSEFARNGRKIHVRF